MWNHISWRQRRWWRQRRRRTLTKQLQMVSRTIRSNVIKWLDSLLSRSLFHFAFNFFLHLRFLFLVSRQLKCHRTMCCSIVMCTKIPKFHLIRQMKAFRAVTIAGLNLLDERYKIIKWNYLSLGIRSIVLATLFVIHTHRDRGETSDEINRRLLWCSQFLK